MDYCVSIISMDFMLNSDEPDQEWEARQEIVFDAFGSGWANGGGVYFWTAVQLPSGPKSWGEPGAGFDAPGRYTAVEQSSGYLERPIQDPTVDEIWEIEFTSPVPDWQVCGTLASSSPRCYQVPEPPSALLALVGALGVFGIGYLRRRTDAEA